MKIRNVAAGVAASGAFVAVLATGVPTASADTSPGPSGSAKAPGTAPKAAAAKPTATAQVAKKPKGGAKAGGGSTAIGGIDPRLALGGTAAAAGTLVLGVPMLRRRGRVRISVAH